MRDGYLCVTMGSGSSQGFVPELGLDCFGLCNNTYGCQMAEMKYLTCTLHSYVCEFLALDDNSKQCTQGKHIRHLESASFQRCSPVMFSL